MAGSLGDLIQLVDNQTYLGQQCLNVYYYRITASLGLGSGYLSDLDGWWETNVLAPIVDIQNTGLAHVSREWRNLTNGSDLFSNNTVVNGDVATSVAGRLPSYVSLGFLLQRESLVTRNGYKRLAGLSDADVEGNICVIPSSQIHAIEGALASDISLGLATVAEPIIVKRPIAVPVTTYLYSSIGSASFRSVGTQNTRKAGRGV